MRLLLFDVVLLEMNRRLQLVVMDVPLANLKAQELLRRGNGFVIGGSLRQVIVERDLTGAGSADNAAGEADQEAKGSGDVAHQGSHIKKLSKVSCDVLCVY